MKYQHNGFKTKTIIFTLMAMIFLLAGQGAAQSSQGPLPKGNLQGGPPPGKMGNGPGPMMKPVELEEKKASDYFVDLDSTTAQINAYVDYLFEKKLITDPEGNKRFRPKEKLTRGEFAFMLNSKYKFAKANARYEDVPPDAYYHDAIARGKASAVFDDTKTFSPEKPITRGQLAVWTLRAEVKNGMPMFMISSDVSAFKDGASFSPELAKAVGTLAKLNVVKADGNGNFNPSGEINRSEIVRVLFSLSFLGGGPEGPGGKGVSGPMPMGGPGGPGGPGMMPGGGHGTVDHGRAANTVVTNVTGKTFTAEGDAENALRVEGDVNVTLNRVVIKKTAGQATGGDACNFYGSNAAFLAMGGAKVVIGNSRVESSANGGNGIFSHGRGTDVTVNNCTIATSKGNSGGVMITGGGKMTVSHGQIETLGRSSAALRSDRGGGLLIVNGGTYIAHGEGSPSIYSTADIRVNDATLKATTSEAVVIEGKNSVALKNCIVSGKMTKNNVQNLQNVMIYQSMSGDAEPGRSSFTMEGGSLTSESGDMFYVTNTSCTIRLQNVALTPFNDVFLKVVGNDARNGWGMVGKNGGNCDFTAQNQRITGKIIVDEISTLAISLTQGSQFSGSINAGKQGGDVFLTIDQGSHWTLTGNSYVTSLSGSLKNINTNGYQLYVDGTTLN